MKDIKAKIESTLSRSVCGGWDRSFLESILEQLAKARDLSVKQKQTLGKVLARNTKEAQEVHDSWSDTYEKEYKAAALVLAAYHTHQPYYRPMSEDILCGKVPERNKFLRMHDNKYSKKVMAQYECDPKYTKGEYLIPRAAFSNFKNIEFVVDIAWTDQRRITDSFKSRGGFVLEICKEIRSPAKGAKRYKLLSIGETTPFIVEERFLKRGKIKN
jgi:hypothetical protein